MDQIIEKRPLEIVIVGGSLAGLMQGIVLKRLGHNIRILEQDPSSIRKSEAAGIRAGPQAQEFFEEYDLIEEPWSISCPGLKFIRNDCSVQRFIDFPMVMTGWSTLYYRLRANFDGFASEYCPKPPTATDDDGMAIYDAGMRVTSFKVTEEKITLEFENVSNGAKGQVSPDLVIAADGSASRMREWTCDVKRPFEGYVAWRGSVVEKDVSEETRSLCADTFTVFKMKRNYILVYIIPGHNGSLVPGERLLNFVWYYNVSENSQEYADMMTDNTGHRHRFTLPPGSMAPAVWEKQKIYAREVLAPPFVELINKTTQPFISSVTEAQMPKASYFDGKLIFVGDALSQFRPHIALSANQAAMNALLLKRVMLGEITMQQWERQVLNYGNEKRLLSRVTGTYAQFGGVKLVAAVLKYGWTLASNFVTSKFY